MTTSTHRQLTLLVLALVSIYPSQAGAATAAGIAQFIAGDVNVRGSDGKTDTLLKGKDIESGQAIVTGINGRAQVRFSDGGLISLQPNTEFKISNYVDKADPQQDRFLVDLLRGSMRAVTGLIGKRNRANYKVTTTTATIGIRGSGFNAGYNPDGSLSVTAEKDAIEVCSGGSCVGLVAGESVRVNNSNAPPVRTINRASLPTPGSAQAVVIAGNQTTPDGKSPLIEPIPPVPVIRSFTDIQVSAVGSDSLSGSQDIVTATDATTVFSDNKLTQFTGTSSGTPILFESGTPAPADSFESRGKVTDPNFIGWGRWKKTTRDVHGNFLLDQKHYVAGRPAPQSAIGSNLTGTYTLIGATAPTQNGVTGTLNSATLNVALTNVQNYSVTAEINTSFVNFSDTATIVAPAFTGANGFMKGLFIGTNAGFVGLTYSKLVAGGPVTGALAFRK